MGLGHEQLPEHQVIGLEDLLEDGLVEIVVVEDPDFTAHMGHIVDDGVSLGLLETEIVGFPPVFLDQIHKGIHRKGIVLGGNGELLLASRLFLIPGFQEVCLFQHLPSIPQENFSFLGQVDPLVGPLKIWMPISRSSSRTILVRLGWVMNRALAAPLKVPASAMATI